jgi:hypothetical protein
MSPPRHSMATGPWIRLERYSWSIRRPCPPGISLRNSRLAVLYSEQLGLPCWQHLTLRVAEFPAHGSAFVRMGSETPTLEEMDSIGIGDA